jgi:hypothetical protein
MSDECDVAYDDFCQRVDDGLACPICHVRTLTGEPYRCPSCFHRWQDPAAPFDVGAHIWNMAVGMNRTMAQSVKGKK